jgi:hypothetical protein
MRSKIGSGQLLYFIVSLFVVKNASDSLIHALEPRYRDSESYLG